jgi:hypothetical protein
MAGSAVTNAQEPGLTNVAVTTSTVSGVLECQTIVDQSPCGRDEFTMTTQADGTRAIRAISSSDQRGLQINIYLRVDAAFRPLEAFTQSYSDGVSGGRVLCGSR